MSFSQIKRSSFTVSTLNEVENELSNQLSEIKKLSLQPVAHRKKFQLAISQYSKFLDAFKEELDMQQQQSSVNSISTTSKEENNNDNNGNVINNTNSNSNSNSNINNINPFNFISRANSVLEKNDDHNQKRASLTPIQLESYQNMTKITREYYQIFSQHFLHCWAHTAIDNSCTQVAADLCQIAQRLHDESSNLSPSGSQFFDAQDDQWLQFHILDLRAIKASFNQYISSAGANQKVVHLMEEKLESVHRFLEKYETEGHLPGARVFSPIPINYQIWRVEHTDFTEESEEGSGGMAVVFYGHFKPTGQEIAVKKLKYTKLSGKKLSTFQREIVIFATAKHPTLLGFVGATDTSPYCILTEWMGGGSLYHEIHKRHNLDQTQYTIAAVDIARGMNFLHSMKIIHRDLKSLNVLLDNFGNAKICDFGLSRYKTSDEEAMTQNIGTPHWMAPELLGGSANYNEKIDVYAYGIVLWEMLTKKLPYVGMDQNMIIGQVLVNDLRPFIPGDTPVHLKTLIESCWHRESKMRPSFQEILKCWRTGDVFFPGADQEKVRRHIEETYDPVERACSDVESHLSSNDSSGIEKFAQTLQKDGIPGELADRCWENLRSINHEGHEEAYISCLGMFLRTVKVNEAAAQLRMLPRRNALPHLLVQEICDMLPTGNSQLEDDLVMIACKNGAIEECFIRSINKKHIITTLELLARQNIDNNNYIRNNNNNNKNTLEVNCFNNDINSNENNNENNAKKCNIENANNKSNIRSAVLDRVERLLLTYDDTSVKVAIFRFLVSLNETKRIPMTMIKNNLHCRNMTLKNATYVAAAKMASEGVKLPTELIEVCASEWGSIQLAGTVIVNACRNMENAVFILNRVAYGVRPPPELMVMILIQCSQHIELRSSVKVVIGQSIIPRTNHEVAKALGILENLPENQE